MPDHLTHHDPAVRLLIEQAEARGAERALRAADEMPDGGKWSHLRRYGWQHWLRDRAEAIRNG